MLWTLPRTAEICQQVCEKLRVLKEEEKYCRPRSCQRQTWKGSMEAHVVTVSWTSEGDKRKSEGYCDKSRCVNEDRWGWSGVRGDSFQFYLWCRSANCARHNGRSICITPDMLKPHRDNLSSLFDVSFYLLFFMLLMSRMWSPKYPKEFTRKKDDLTERRLPGQEANSVMSPRSLDE